jgi:hypothetical protein
LFTHLLYNPELKTKKWNEKKGCPFCSKLAVFLGEANLMDKVTFEPDDAKNRAYITQKCGKATFPAMEYEPGEWYIYIYRERERERELLLST